LAELYKYFDKFPNGERLAVQRVHFITTQAKLCHDLYLPTNGTVYKDLGLLRLDYNRFYKIIDYIFPIQCMNFPSDHCDIHA
jgi:hypothetical protein